MMKLTKLIGVVVFLLLSACERMETIENKYSSSKEAISAGAIERGWIPKFLPPSAYDITEKHNLDTNEVWLQFSMDPSDLIFIENSCHRTELVKVIFPRIENNDWWPKDLTENRGESSQQQMAGYTHYRCESGGAVAVERNSQKVYYWHPG